MENIVTSSNFQVAGENPETQAVMDYLNGHRTKAQIICEFFGIRPQDRSKTPVLKKACVSLLPALKKLGVTLEDLKEFVDGALEDEDLIPKDEEPVEKERAEEPVEKKKRAKKQEPEAVTEA